VSEHLSSRGAPSGGQGEAGEKLATGEGTFAGVLTTGGTQQLVIHEQPGVYVLYSIMKVQDTRHDYQLGMFRTIRIVK
jgi:hypothetical protein